MSAQPRTSAHWQFRTPKQTLLRWMGWFWLVALTVVCWQLMNENTIWAFVSDAPEQAADIGERMFPPAWGYLPSLWEPLWDTINIATLGTLLGILFAIPVAFLAATNTTLGSTQANALDGQYTAADALIHLVRGSGFEVHLDNGRYRVNHADAQALQRRIKTLTRDIDSVADAQALSKTREAALRKQLGAVWTSAQRLIREQGFLSAAEKASYNRTFAYITGQLKTAVGR